MKRFILSSAPNAEGMVHLYDKDYHYLVRVRRLHEGSLFPAILPDGGEVQVRVLSTVDNILIGECCTSTEGKVIPRAQGIDLPPIALFQGLPKAGKMDTIVRQAAEGGISVVVPFETEYSTGKVSGNASEKLKRWQRIVREARQQSGSSIETEVRAPCTVADLLAYWDELKKTYQRPTAILLHQEPIEQGSFHGYIGNDPDFTVLAVGPEGGFSPSEVLLFVAAGFKPLCMGTTILRVETAALYAAAALRIILLERASWIRKE